MRITLFASALALSCAFVACSESTPAPLSNGTPSDQDGGGNGDTMLGEPAVACTDAADAIYGAPGTLPDAKGAIIKCTKDPELAKDAIQAKLGELGYQGKAVTSGAKVYRVSYRTERGDAAKTPAVSSAAVYVPTVQRTGKLPVVIAARGSRGQAAACTASKLDPVADGVNQDYFRLVYSLVGAGYAVVAPDLAGYANFGAPGNPPSAYAQAEDVGKSTLDGGRALKKLFPQLGDKTVIVGHSQGGHSALAALALSESYGTEGTIAGVAVYAPLWLSQRSWGALLDSGIGAGYPIAGQPSPNAVSIWYHYTQAELLDGPGEGKKLFAAAKQDAVKDFVDTQCWASSYPKLEALGTYGYELFDAAFVKAVSARAAYGGDCDPGSVCEKWIKRYSADRPHITGAAVKVPILMLYGGADTTIPPTRMRCGLDRLKDDGVNLSVCIEASATHGSILDMRSSYVADWLGSVTLGEAAPAACAANESAITATCAVPPPND
ncbi:Triacylglycerol lipase precursor [Labilithrix luteola]|uniref:Triacylglycerol lipase n=1 Tax=Labilithrix luteola TaxID=1391654 RepID=A0A0K1QAM4_9BACT|nr:alpha/beta fold hydrolase [Labilithrix luteola]AKV02475.1 Triacylglycerol lipase precursor [Labilithrix luteola]